MPDDPIVLERLIGAPPEVVYSYLTVATKWALWQGTAARLDARPGGVFAVSMENGMEARGEFVELEPGRRVVFTWGWEGHAEVPPGSSTVEIVLVATPSGTRLTLTHSGLPNGEIPAHTAGWKLYLPQLGDAAEAGGGTPPA